ncbi:MAG: oprP, partial [Armatimonadetes bacterium]|nr:oprP [Armatimonadota bacterium]
FKQPFSLERLQGAPDLAFVERSISNNLGTNRDVGVQLSGDLWGERLSYALGAFNGLADGASGDTDAGSDKDFVGRIFAQPFHNQPKSPLKNLGLGIATTIGVRDESVANINSRTAGRSSYFRYNSGVMGDGTVLRLAPQLYYYHGPFGLMSEYITSRQELVRTTAGGTTAGTVTNKGGFLQATYVLTGEDATFRTVNPKKPFDPAKGQWGAFEIGLRYSRVNVDDDVYRLGLADPANSVSRASAWTVGLNWYLNRVFKLQLNYERTDFDHALLFGTDRVDHEDVFLSRIQVAF